MQLFKPTYHDHRTGETRATEFWYLRHKSKRYSLGVKDKRTAELKARALIDQLELGFQPKKIKASRRDSIYKLIDNWIASRTCKEAHRKTQSQQIRKLVGELKTYTLAEFTGEACVGWLRTSTLAAQTKHHYTRMLKQFGKWLVATGCVARNPYQMLPAVTGIAADRKLERRALASDEIATLLVSVAKSKRNFKIPSYARVMLYRTALTTGLRRSEVGSLTPESFTFGDSPSVLVEARNTKNKKVAFLPIHPELAPDLERFVRTKAPGQIIWPIGTTKMAIVIRTDLEDAGIPVVRNGKRVDWHALRTTFGTRLALANVPLALAQQLMRHSDPRLTANVYTVVQLGDLAREVAKL